MKYLLPVLGFCLLFSQVASQTYWDYSTTWTGTCVSGKSQSPIDVNPYTEEIKDNNRAITLSYKTEDELYELHWDFNYKFIAETDYGTISLYDVNGNGPYVYKAAQFHWHVPTEHAVNGKRYDLELHIVHTNTTATASKANAVIGVMFQTGAANDFVSKVQQNTGKISLNGFFSSNKLYDYYTYSGGLTTPTCDESVNWFVMKKIYTLSGTQLSFFTKLWTSNVSFPGNGAENSNARNLQATNGRKIVLVAKNSGMLTASSAISFIFILAFSLF